MYKRILLPLLAASAVLYVTGCDQTVSIATTNGVTGYWLQQTANRPMALHIQKQGSDYVVKIGRLSFGQYDITNQPASLSDTGILTIDKRKQLRLDPATDILSDVDHSAIRFMRITQAQYEQASHAMSQPTTR